MAARRKKPARRTIAAWVVPDNIATGPFRIDDIVRATALLPRWEKGDPIGFSRRGLEVAIMNGATEHANRLSPILADLDHVALAAERAAAAMQYLLRALAGRVPTNSAELVQPILRSSRTIEPTAPRIHGEVAATALWSSTVLVADIASTIRKRKRALSAGRLNDGDAAFRAFASVVGLTWLHLTGARPTASGEGSPFQRYLAAAWQDAGGGSDDGYPDAPGLYFRASQEARSAVSEASIGTLLEGLPEWARA